jgi:CubicO group peptidase (beta-lactamase class C family)
MAMLVEDNDAYPQVQWETPISQLIRDDFVLASEDVTQKVTVEDALSHRTGLPRHDLALGSTIGSDTTAVRDIVRQLRHLPLTAELRTKFQYNNAMFIVAAHVIETVTGEPLGDLLARRIWGPLGMTETYFSLEDARGPNGENPLAHGYAYNYADDDGTYRTIEWMPPAGTSGAGGVISSVNDYAKWARALLTGSPALFASPNTVREQLWRPRTHLPVERYGSAFTGPGSYTLGWQTGVYRGVEFFEHQGGMNAFGAELILIPELQYAVVTLANTAGTSNCAEQTLVFHLIDKKLGVRPDQPRFNWDAKNLAAIERGRRDVATAVSRFYPSLPSPPLPTTLPLSLYTGAYFHPGYGSVTIYLDHRRSSSGSSVILRADRNRTTWPEILRFKHASGDFFIAESEHDGDSGALYPSVYPVEFRIGAAGTVIALGIGWEKEMEGKIWLERVQKKEKNQSNAH